MMKCPFNRGSMLATALLSLALWACQAESPSSPADAAAPGPGTLAPMNPAAMPTGDAPANAAPATGVMATQPVAPTDGTPVDSTQPVAGSGADPGPMEPVDVTPETPATPTESYTVAPDPTSAALSPSGRSTANGPFQLGSYAEGYEDSPAYADATIWYPKDAEPPFAAVAIVPGFASPQSSVSDWGPFLASHGIVAITIGTNDTLDDPTMRSTALMAALGTLESEHVRSGSPLEGKVDSGRLGVMGWSMGGGGALIASSANPQLRAAICMAAWSPGATFPQSKVPTLLFAGTADSLAAGQSQGFYTSIPESTTKMLFEVQGAPHEVANTPSNSGGAIGRYGLSWLKVFLEDDERYRPFLEEMPTGTSDFRTNL